MASEQSEAETEQSLNVLNRIKRRVFCEWLDWHVGYPEAYGDVMYFYCTRCDELTNPVDLPDGVFLMGDLK